VLAIASAVLVLAAAAWLAVLRRPRTGAHAAYSGPYPRRAGYPAPGTQYGGRDDGWRQE
jgi:hypothetical protein